MSNREFYLARRAVELPVFLDVMRALPREKIDYTPHERSPSARKICWTMALETKGCRGLVEAGRVDWAEPPPPENLDQIFSMFEEGYRELDAAAANLDDEGWQRPAGLYAGGEKMMELPTGEFLWFMFFDQIHHRGQLSTYIRPMGGKVPAIYGPSGDQASQK